MLTRKVLSEAFWNGELRAEMEHRNMLHTHGIGPTQSREDIMKEIDRQRRNELYPHTPADCNDDCRKKGFCLSFCTSCTCCIDLK